MTAVEVAELTEAGRGKGRSRQPQTGSSIKLKLTRQSVNELFGGHVAMCPGNEEGNAARTTTTTKPQTTTWLRAQGHSAVVVVAVVVAVAAVVVFDVFVVAIDIGAQMNFIKGGEQKPKRNCNKHCRQLKKLKADRASLHSGAERQTEECE